MKKINKECLVCIKKTYKKFLSILIIVLLGVGFFAGIKATSPDMKNTVDTYYKNNNMYDILLTSTYGITGEEIDLIKSKGYNIEPSYSLDALVKTEEEYAVKVMSFDKDGTINKLILKEGTLPINNNECVIEKTINFNINDTILVETDSLKSKELKIVGIVESPIYISRERGTTKLLSGNINYYLYTPITNFNSKYFTEAYIDLKIEENVFSKNYENKVEKEEKKVKNIVRSLGMDRYKEVLKYNVEPLALKWYVLDINSNIGFNSYSKDAERINNVAKVFPIVFFVVAILICLTTMTRMVEEERVQIGTLKSLGYTDTSIMYKYLLYAFLATIVGSLIGVIIGFNIIPKIIFNMYSMMYTLGNFQSDFHFIYIVIGTLVAIMCTLGATYYTCIKTLKEVPAELLRQKSPKVGKRVILEKIPFIWKHLNFTQKVTIRNVFRYKKRFLMTIIGISGCTGLILAGFGIKDSITNMVPKQYEEIYNFEVAVTLNNDLSIEEKNKSFEEIKEFEEINDLLKVQREAVTLNNYKTDEIIQLIIPFGEINDFISLRNRSNGKTYKLKNDVIVTEKLIKLLNLKSGNKIEINSDSNIYNVKINNITENYLMHYIYMNKSVYNKEDYNTIFLKTKQMNSKEEKEFSNKLKNIQGVSSLSFNSFTKNIFNDAMKNFAYVSLVLIVSAGLLAFVVLYSLESVNISERKRELASLKVLGFYDKEVYNYISRETVILSSIGMILGVGVGIILTRFIMKTCELDMIMFDKKINNISYIYSLGITMIFILFVKISTFYSLKKINMIESLKSVE